ncbi:MAG: hypothetical protein ACK4TA_07330 [Saprospiraceae bacterium]
MKSLNALLSFIFLIVGSLQANDSTKVHSIFDDFYQPDQVVEVTLQFDCKQLIRQKEKQEKFPATITYQRPNGESVTRAIQVKTRGKLRLNVCTFPPLKLDFDKDELKNENFLAEFDDLKLVTHCQNVKFNDRQVLKELLAYRLYNIISDYSLRAQLLRIKYLDAQGALFADEYALLLESEEALAYRMNCRKSEKIIENISELQSDIYNKMVLFQYMIGNVDWHIRAQHNVTFFKSLGAGFRVIVPYDFDYSGVVSASYAVPDERVGQKFLGERVMVSNFTDEAAMQSAVQYFIEKEENIIQTCNNFSTLSPEERQTVIKYLAPFFEFIKTPNLKSGKFVNHGGIK